MRYIDRPTLDDVISALTAIRAKHGGDLIVTTPTAEEGVSRVYLATQRGLAYECHPEDGPPKFIILE